MRRVRVEAVCSRDQVFSHTCDGRGLQTVPKDECEREGTCSAEVMFILKQMVGWPGRVSEMSEEEEYWKVFVWMERLCDVQSIAHCDQNPQPCCGPQVAERFSHVVGKAISCTRLRKSRKASLCERFVSNAHHRHKNVRPKVNA